MKNVYLIRHGLPDFPDGKRMCLGRTDLPLNETGRKQAAKAAELLKAEDFTLYSSPLLRAKQTAEAFCKPFTVIEDLQELYAGEWDGLTFDQIRTRYAELYAARANDKSLPLPGAESNAVGLERFHRAMVAAAESCPGDLAVVAHGGVIGLFLQEVSGAWRKPDYCEILHLTYDNHKFQLLGGYHHA